jgi:acetyl/propionyl-CoA carboxylase alpha subunit
VRIIRAAKELDLRTVAVFSDADKESLAVRLDGRADIPAWRQATRIPASSSLSR